MHTKRAVDYSVNHLQFSTFFSSFHFFLLIAKVKSKEYPHLVENLKSTENCKKVGRKAFIILSQRELLVSFNVII